jgi:electron transfer flavoprotein beta subunit
MKVVVVIKQVPDTWSERRLDVTTGRLDRDASDRVIDEIGERAIELALTLKDADKSTSVTLLTMGPDESLGALRKGLSMGADDAIHIVDDSLRGADAILTSAALAAAIAGRDWDLVIAGNESTDGRGGVMASLLAERLGVPAATALASVSISDAGLVGERGTESGTSRVYAALPAVISITERMPEARFPNFKGIMGAKKKPVAVLSAADLGLTANTSRTSVISTMERPPRQAGLTLVDDGTAASALADFLAAERLI